MTLPRLPDAANDCDALPALCGRLRQEGFAFVERPQALALVQAPPLPALSDWAAFAASWEGLEVDAYMADGGRYRRRAHGLFLAGGAGAPGQVERLPHGPHYQALHHNRLNGGIERWFQPIDAAVAEGECFRALLGFAQGLFSTLSPEVGRWQVEAHQFRIEALPGQPGQPTPEGVHRDGVDHVLVALIGRRNIRRGTTTVHAADGRELGSFTLAAPLDLALVDDRQVWHGVTAVEPIDPALPACRDVLVLTFRRQLEGC
ncbi:MAG: 2OG-Fe dioxygenase family protein [Aquimonas sp.]|nr:2OG-Fe dioxygenase family protein [Aquimonas sp.]